MNGLIGKKLGMTQVWDETGKRVAVTVLEAGPCPVVQLKRSETEGYAAAQLGFAPQKAHRISKPLVERFKKAGVEPCRLLREFALDDGEAPEVGQNVTVSIFKEVARVDVSGWSKGRGFAGVMRRHGFGGGPKTHGGQAKRRPGSVGHAEQPGRIQKNKKMPGHMGHRRVKARNLPVVQVRDDLNLLVVRGAVPGPVGAYVTICKALRKG